MSYFNKYPRNLNWNLLSVLSLIWIFFSAISQSFSQGGSHISGNWVGHNFQGSNSALFGAFIAYNDGSGLGLGSHNSFFGIDAGINHESGDYNAYFGARTGTVNSHGGNNTFIGANAALFDRGSKNTFVGSSAGLNSTNDLNSGDFNSYFGYQTGSTNYDGSFNSYFGTRIQDFRGESTSSFGYKAGGGSTSVYFGSDAGLVSSTLQNAIFGAKSGENHRKGGNIILGYGAGRPESEEPDSVSSLLYIHNDVSDTPLIYGEFIITPINGGEVNTPLLRINGKFEAMGGTAGLSDFSAKEAITDINYELLLEKISQLNISEWQYKDYPDERHIGPMAQDFHAVFGLGKNDTTISSIDADGIILTGIKAMIHRNDILQNDMDKLSAENAEIIIKLKEQVNGN